MRILCHDELRPAIYNKIPHPKMGDLAGEGELPLPFRLFSYFPITMRSSGFLALAVDLVMVWNSMVWEDSLL